MAKGSEKFAWKQFPGAVRECWECGKALKVVDVAEVRRVFPSNVSQFRCTECMRRIIDARISEAREENQRP